MKDDLTRLAILYGGPSSERDVSFGTRDFFHEMYKELNPLIVEWGNDFKFYFNNEILQEQDFLNYLKENSFVVIIASHGEYVEDGYIQEKFENNGISFTGSDSRSCKLSIDKFATQNRVQDVVQIVPTYHTYENLSFPFIAKPNNLGSSVGVYLIQDAKTLEELVDLLTNGVEYIYQPYIKGLELSLGTVRDLDGFMELFPTEIIPKASFFDYTSKYKPGASTEITPARLGDAQIIELRKITNEIHEKLGLGYYSRSDYILSDAGELYYLETNALPGMTATSLVPQQLNYSNKMLDFKVGLLNNLVC